jgi:uncharacterized protein
VRLSRFVKVYGDVRPGEHVLYDVIADRYAGVDDRTLQAIERWRHELPAPGEEAEAAKTFAELGFLVNGDEADEARLAASMKRAGEGMPGTAHVTVLTTLACNLACTYCMQKDHPQTGHMSAEVEAASLEWIENVAVRPGTQKLEILYIGGEPLTRKDFILRTAERLSRSVRQRGVAFTWEIITNGVLLDVAFAQAMVAFGPGLIKVTLDGDRETHDANRIYRDGRGSFEKILANLAAVARACPEVRVNVGGNFRPGQERSFERLLDRLEAEGLRGRIGSIRFTPVLESAGCGAGCGTSQRGESFVQLGRKAAERGLSRLPTGSIDEVNPCALHWEQPSVIDPNGRLYKCFAVAGRPEMAVGDVRGGPGRVDPINAARPWGECRDCAFQPVCLGGCVGGHYATQGVIDVVCERPQLEERFREQVVRRYLEEFSAVPDQAA